MKSNYLYFIYSALISMLVSTICFADSSIRTELSKGMDPHMKLKVEETKKSILAEGPRFELVGVLENGLKSSFAVNGEDFTVNQDTQIDGSLKTGANVQVVGKIVSGIKYAKQVFVTDNANQIFNQSEQPTTDRIQR